MGVILQQKLCIHEAVRVSCVKYQGVRTTIPYYGSVRDRRGVRISVDRQIDERAELLNNK